MKAAQLTGASDFLEKTEPFSSTINTKKENIRIRRRSGKVYFQICNSCYWCATYFGIHGLETLSESSSYVLDCQFCNSHNTNLMPVLPTESFRMEYDITKHMEMEFYKNTNVSVT